MTDTERAKKWRMENHDRYLAFLREWRIKNPEYMREYRRTNRNKIAEQTHEWRVKNAAHLKEYDRQSRIKNRERRSEHNKQWRLHNPDKRSKNEALRRAKKRLATIGDLTEIAKVYDRAKWWAQWFAVEVDHVISLAKGGTHEAKNLQIIYDFENRRKYARSDYKPRVVFV